MRPAHFCLWLSLAALSGCGTYVNTRNPQANLQADRASCDAEAEQAHPTIWQKKFNYIHAECVQRDKYAQCMKTVPARWETREFNINQGAQQSFVKDCLENKGWVYEFR